MIPTDMPKLESPFVRVGERHLVTPEIAQGYEWVLSDPAVIATEKLDGTNVAVLVEHGVPLPSSTVTLTV